MLIVPGSTARCGSRSELLRSRFMANGRSAGVSPAVREGVEARTSRPPVTPRFEPRFETLAVFREITNTREMAGGTPALRQEEST
jgi:hypothetical protein